MTKRIRIQTLACVALLGLSFAGLYGQAVKVDPALPAYSKVSGISGNLNVIGSDTLNNVMTLWAEEFRRVYPNVRIQIEGKGSSTAPPALISGTAQLGPMSREMKPSEIDKFEQRFGYKPTLFRVAIDGLAVYVHRDNPIEHLTMAQVDAIFSRTRKGGHETDIGSWGQIGLPGSWSERPISMYGRNSVSGTYGYFKEKALFKGDYKDTVKEQPGSAAVVQGVGRDIGAIGYSGIGYKTSEVKAVPLQAKDGQFVAPDADGVMSGKYPLARFLYVYANKAPNRPLDPVVREFMKLALSREGQGIVVKDGYLPLTAALASKLQSEHLK